jgi:hypothetical protein
MAPCDCAHRIRDVGGFHDRRQIEMHGPRPPRRDDPVKAKPHRCRVTVEGKRHGLSRQRLGVIVQECLGDARRFVPATRSPARRVAGLALNEAAFGRPLDLLLQEIIRHRRVSFCQIYRTVFTHASCVLLQNLRLLRIDPSCPFDTTSAAFLSI